MKYTLTDPLQDPAVVSNSVSVNLIADTGYIHLVITVHTGTRVLVDTETVTDPELIALLTSIVKPVRWDTTAQWHYWYERYRILNNREITVFTDPPGNDSGTIY